MIYFRLNILLLFIFSLTIIYAALSSTLDITGNAEVIASEWNFKLEKFDMSSLDVPEDINYFDNYIYYGGAKLVKEATVSGTSIKDFSVAVAKPGDIIEIAYLITITGSIPALYSDYILNEPTFDNLCN